MAVQFHSHQLGVTMPNTEKNFPHLSAVKAFLMSLGISEQEISVWENSHDCNSGQLGRVLRRLVDEYDRTEQREIKKLSYRDSQ